MIRVAPFGDVERADAPVPTDQELLAAYVRGDRDALGALYDRHRRSVYRFLGRLTSARQADLDDLVQATFVHAARAASRFDGRAAVSTWFFGIAVNVARRHRRSAARRFRVIADAGEDGPPEAPGPDRPDQNAETRELLRRVERAIDALSEELREPFVACEIEGLSGVEVARTLGIPEGTLWRRLHEARKQVRRAALGGAA